MMTVTTLIAMIVGLAIGALLFCLVSLLWKKRHSADSQKRDDLVQTLKSEKASLTAEISGLQRDLAVEQEKASRTPFLEAELNMHRQQIDTLRQGKSDIETELAVAKTLLEKEQKQSQEKIDLLVEAKQSMVNEFKVLSATVMDQQGQTFSKQNKEQIDGLLQPLRDKLTDFQQGLQAANAESIRERTALGEHIKQLTTASSRMSEETTNLTKALKGESKTQGAWGEMILATILERCGLREGEEYVTQASHANDEGQRLRPDVIVNLPGKQCLIIDAKVSLVAFERQVNADSEAEAAVFLRSHVESMKTHIKALSSKEYQSLAGGALDYVIMFVPIEGALAAALQHDPELTSFAVQNNVAIATPTTLMIALRTVHSVWQVEKRNVNAEEIADRAGKMYAKFVAFLQDLTTVGTRLNQARTSYDGALAKLSTGQGNLTRQFEQMKELGARTTKSLAGHLRDVEHNEVTMITDKTTVINTHEVVHMEQAEDAV
jgi:DNA recombination protein RmuC